MYMYAALYMISRCTMISRHKNMYKYKKVAYILIVKGVFLCYVHIRTRTLVGKQEVHSYVHMYIDLLI